MYYVLLLTHGLKVKIEIEVRGIIMRAFLIRVDYAITFATVNWYKDILLLLPNKFYCKEIQLAYF